MINSPRHSLPVFLSLISLTGLAFAQSVYEAIVGNSEFVFLRQINHSDLLLIILSFNVAPAAVLWLVWRLLYRWRTGAANIFLSASFFLLLTPFLFEFHKTYLSLWLGFRHNTMLVCIPLALGAFVVSRHRSQVERFLLVLSPVVILFPALFLVRVWHEVSPTGGPPASAIENRAGDPRKAHPPIFMVVLDELTRPALLDSLGNIDASRFPHFATLAQHSTWFDNATANAERTTRSIPVIVTGNFPQGKDVSDAAHPNNLFRLLAPDYDITIHEVVTRFCVSPDYHCPDEERVRRQNLLPAIGELYFRRIAPGSFTLKLQADYLRDEQQRFREFLAEIAPPVGGKPVVKFMHHLLPHSPYMLTPDGALHLVYPNLFAESWAGDSTLLQRLRNDYEMQIEFVDRELGEFIDRLEQAGLYDQSLIVVTADHGVSWKSNAPGRTLIDSNADMIFPVPLLIKLPGQTKGEVLSADAQSIDLVPTIAAVAGVNIPWQVAGRDLFGPPGPPREKVMIDLNGRKFAYPPNFAATLPAVANR